MNARWIRCHAEEALDFDEACAALVAAQTRASAPILLWADGRSEYRFALIVPNRLLPGKRPRWLSWALASAVATYRQFGVRAYQEGDAVWLHGRKIAECTFAEIGECVVFASSFLMQFPAKCVVTPSVELQEAFRLRLEAQHGWQFDHSWPRARESVRYALA